MAINNAGWHCSFFGGVDTVANKLSWIVEVCDVL
jgi:hypothetical protein